MVRADTQGLQVVESVRRGPVLIQRRCSYAAIENLSIAYRRSPVANQGKLHSSTVARVVMRKPKPLFCNGRHVTPDFPMQGSTMIMRQFERLGKGVGFGEPEKSAIDLDLIPAAT